MINILAPCSVKTGIITLFRKKKPLLFLLIIILSAAINITSAQESAWEYINGDALPDALNWPRVVNSKLVSGQ